MEAQNIDPKSNDHKNSSLHLVSHHSVPGDWDFRYLYNWAVPAWMLDTGKYLSAPSSLFLPTYSAGYRDTLAISELAQCQNMQQGRIEGYWASSADMGGYAQVFLGITAPYTCAILIYAGILYIDWILWRVTWWFAYDYQNQPSTRVKVDQWIAGAWVELSLTDYPPLSGPINQIAVGGMGGPGSANVWLDNTSIYIPT